MDYIDKLKRCSCCNKYYEEKFFNKNVSTIDGLSFQCKECHRNSNKKYYLRKKMNQKRMNIIYSGLSNVSQKVYDAVPKITPCNEASLINEVKRKTGHTIQLSSVRLAVSTLVSGGLVIEPLPGLYLRAKAVEKEPESDPVPVPVSESKSGSSIGVLYGIAENMLVLASQIDQISLVALNIKKSIENAAIEIEKNNGKNNAEFEQLRHFQALMKGMQAK